MRVYCFTSSSNTKQSNANKEEQSIRLSWMCNDQSRDYIVLRTWTRIGDTLSGHQYFLDDCLKADVYAHSWWIVMYSLRGRAHKVTTN